MRLSVTINDRNLNAWLRGRPRSVKNAVMQEMEQLRLEIPMGIAAEKLSGRPLTSHTYKLASSLVAIPKQSGFNVGISVHSDLNVAEYGYVHEYGGTFEVREYIQRSKLSSHLRTVRPHVVVFPERSFMRSWLSDHEAELEERIAQAVLRGLMEDDNVSA